MTFQSSQKSLLKRRTFKVVGFINSSEIWSTLNLGASTAGDGSLSSYALVTSSAFANKTNTLARIRYRKLKNSNPFSDDYSSRVNYYQDKLDKLLEDNGEKRLADLKKAPQAKVDQSKLALAAAKKQLQEKPKKSMLCHPLIGSSRRYNLSKRQGLILLRKKSRFKRPRLRLMLWQSQLTVLIHALPC